MEKRPVLITLTGPSCSGKTTISSALAQFGVSQLVSTTTRLPRLGEIDGKDYYFISNEQSFALEKSNQFAELEVFSGNRYGVTKTEMASKLTNGNACVVVLEPEGVKTYNNICKSLGVLSYNVYVDTDISLRIARLQERFLKDLAVENALYNIESLVSSYTKRLVTSLSKEQLWYDMNQWDMVAFGDKSANAQAMLIMSRAMKIQEKDIDVRSFISSKQHFYIGK